MKAAVRRLVNILGRGWRAAVDFRGATGHSLFVWLLVCLLNVGAQIIFRRSLLPGEFGTLNSVLAAIALTAVPILALRQGFASFSPPGGSTPERGKMLREARLPLIQNSALVWAFVCALLFLPALSLLHPPRPWIGYIALAGVFVALGAAVCASLYEQQDKIRRWAFLLCLAGLARLLIAWRLVPAEPWAEAGLTAGLCAGFILLAPILRQSRIVFDARRMLAVLRDREFCLYLAATVSVMLGLFLFTNADRIVAESSFGQSSDNNLGLVRWGLFDGYQTAGLLGRSILWGTQPLLAVLLVRRAPRLRTLRGDYALLAIYGGALVGGALLLDALARPLAALFGGVDPGATAYFIPGFATAIVPLGLLQGVGFFALASRRFPECFTLGLGALAYTLFLVLEGKPQLMLTCVFGGGGVALLAVLFVAVVRWGRAQP